MKVIRLTKNEAVDKFGSQKCKDHFTKYKKFKSKNVENSLIKSMEQYYEKVSIKKIGRQSIFELKGERNESIARVDGRKKNGKWLDHTHDLDIFILSSLHFEDIEIGEPSSFIKWCYKLKLLSLAHYRFYSVKYDETTYNEVIKKLLNNEIIVSGQGRLLIDFLHSIEKTKIQVVQSFKRLEKLGLISITPYYKGLLKNQPRAVDLSIETFERIKEKRKEMMIELGITEWYVQTFLYAETTKTFNKKWLNYLKSVMKDIEDKDIPLKGIFIEHKVTPIFSDGNDAIKKYLNHYNLNSLLKELDKDEEIFLQKIIFETISGISEYRKNFYSSITIKEQSKINSHLQEFIKSKGLEEIQDEAKKWVLPKLEHTTEYQELHINGDYVTAMFNLEQGIEELYENEQVEDDDDIDISNENAWLNEVLKD